MNSFLLYFQLFRGEADQHPHSLFLIDEQAPRSYGRRSSFMNSLLQVLHVPRAATGDHRQADSLADLPDQVDVISFPGAIPVDGIQKDLSRTRTFQLPGPFNRPKVRPPRTRLTIDLLLAKKALFYVNACNNGLSPINISYL